MGLDMKRVKNIVALVCLVGLVLGSVTVTDATTKAKAKSNKINKEVNLTVEVGETLQIKGIKKVPKIKGLKVINCKDNTLTVKGQKEGVKSFTSNKIKYNIVTLDKVQGLKFDNAEAYKTKGVYYVVRDFGSDSIITVLNTNKSDKDVTFYRKEYRSKNDLFETRPQRVNALGPNESFSFFTFSSMPIHKDSISVSDSTKKSLKKDSVDLSSCKIEDTNGKFTVTNNSKKDVVYVDALVLKFDNDDNMVATDYMVSQRVADKANWYTKNYMDDIIDMKIVSYHVYY